MVAYDAVVVGSGPNGLAAAITMQRQGLSVLLIEGHKQVGGGMRSAELTLPGFVHDVCSAVHPMLTLSPFFKTLPLADFGLKLSNTPLAAAHPFDNGTAAVLGKSVDETADRLGRDAARYRDLFGALTEDLPDLLPDLLGPLTWPSHPVKLGRFGLKALTSANWLGHRFKTVEARGLWAGMAAHSMQPLTNLATSAIGMVLMAAAHVGSWPVIRGGSGQLAQAMHRYFVHLGGVVETDRWVTSLKELPKARVVLLDVTPRQLLSIAGDALPTGYRRRLNNYRYGMGVFKVDYALQEAVPFTGAACRQAGTVHLGNTLEEIRISEVMAASGKHCEKPFVLFAQPGVADASRAPEGKQTGWAYCHVPHGSEEDMLEAVERQIERFAPGFRDVVIGRSVMNAVDMEQYNPNYIGGDINGGVQDLWQLFTRPVVAWKPYRTAAKGIYLCSSSTPPGGGVHGMCGYHAASTALQDFFGISV